MIETRAPSDAFRLAAKGFVVAQELGEHHVAEHQPAHGGEDKIGLRMRPLRRQYFDRRWESGTRWTTLAFIRLVGTVQTRAWRITNSRSARA